MIKLLLPAATGALLSTVLIVAAADANFKFAAACPFGDCASGISFTYLGDFIIKTGHMEKGIEFGGISGMDFDPASGRFIAISDDRSERAAARFYYLDVEVDSGGLRGVQVSDQVVLKKATGEPFAVREVDPESVRLGNEGIYWGSEGDVKALLPPSVRVSSREGTSIRDFELPSSLLPSADGSTGVRDNLAFEALAIAPSGDVFAAIEAALYQDGPIPDLTNGSLARIIRYDGPSGKQKAQYVYAVSPIPQAAAKAGGSQDNGLSEMIALDDRRLLVIERSFAQGFGNNVKLFMIDLEGATDVSGIAALNDQTHFVPVRKTQVLDLRSMGLTPDNIEAMAIGKAQDGSEILLLGSDNNFSTRQKNQFYAFKLDRGSS